MQQERWRRIDELFHGALRLGGESRITYLEKTCSGDEDLRLELERLLVCYTESENFLESAAMDLVARHFDADVETLVLDGAVVSHYRVIRKIGSGGMGVVYEGEDLRLKRRVALKFLSEELTRDREAVERFEAEARAASSLNHPNICTIYEVEEHEGQPAIVMELLEGQNLRQKMQVGRVPVGELIQLGEQAANALAAAHNRGIVHRDIKPANMFWSADGRLKLLDFGVAKLMRPSSDMEGPVASRDCVAGTISYMSPEQIRGEDLDGRSDLFSLGVVLYELATGKRPFAGSNPSLTIEAVLHETAPAPSTLNPALPSGLDRVIARLLEKNRERRYQQAAEIAADLQRLSVKSLRVAGRRWRLAGAVASIAVACFGGALLYRSHHAAVLTGKDNVILADFVNTTKDSIFDGTLRRGLAVQLEQSPYLSLLSDERVAHTLRLMKQPPEARLTPELAREVCQRLAGAAVLEGTIAPLGNEYVLGFRAKTCGSGDVLDRQQVQVAKKEEVLNGLGKIAAKFRARAGESFASLREHDAPLAEATTPSLDALKAYSTAWNISPKVGPVEVVPLLLRAIALDGQFALAHAFLSRVYADIWEGELAEKSIRRAYELRDRTTDSERLFITINYHQQATRNLEKALETARTWARTYERDVRPHAFLSALYQWFARYREAAEEGHKAIVLDPDFTPGYMNLAWAYILMDRPDEGKAVLEQAAERKLYMPEMLVARYYIAFLKADRAEMTRLEAQTLGKPAGEDWLRHQQATIAAYHGELREADRLSRKATELALHDNERERAGVYEAALAVHQALFGNEDAARKQAKAALKISNGRDVKWGAALAFALAGDVRQAEALESELEGRFPEDTCVRFTYLPILRAIVALHRGEPTDAIELLRVAAPFDLAIPGSWSGFFGNMYPVYFRGLAYLAEGRNTEAAAEFQKMLDHPGIIFSDPAAALARLQLARARRKSGDQARARVAYADFLKLWRNGDADVPILKRARQEYAALL